MVETERLFLLSALVGTGCLCGSCGKHQTGLDLPSLYMPADVNSSPQIQLLIPVVFASMSFGGLKARTAKIIHAGLPAFPTSPSYNFSDLTSTEVLEDPKTLEHDRV